MKINSIRIYAECLEQGLDFKEYLLEIDNKLTIDNIYIPKPKGKMLDNDSKLFKILKLKNFDLAISAICKDKEIPILLIEYSTAVPTDDHKIQRSDVYFWAGAFKIPVMKISPLSKNSQGNHGGGDKLDVQKEQTLIIKNNCLVYFIDFKADNNNNLIVNKQRPSCVAKNAEITRILNNILQVYKDSKDDITAYEILLNSHKGNVESCKINEIKALFANSTRFMRDDEDIIVKINRFGHAMDPDRGILFFINMLFGIDNTITKFILKREREKGKESYEALFDALPSQKIIELNKIIKQDFTPQLALKIFQIVTKIDLDFSQISNNSYFIKDDLFKEFLQTYNSNVYKSIFINSKAIMFCDYENNLLCKISWNPKIAKEYKNKISTNFNNYTPLPLEPFLFKHINEDIITFATTLIFKKLGCEILALSYPGAQGDKAIIIGNGKTCKRIYIDIIASFKHDKFYVFLHENKDDFKKLGSDVIKLNNIKINCKDNLNTFLQKIGQENFDKLFLGVGAKSNNNLVEQSLNNIDYIFAFSVDSQDKHTNINFNIGVINLDLVDFFKPLANENNKLQGKVAIDKIYKVS
ncbi:MAG: hypothetical protein SOW25_01625, partial [Helicobacter sp.]|nr:hypothetical protein [Helicobacter sp.]